MKEQKAKVATLSKMLFEDKIEKQDKRSKGKDKKTNGRGAKPGHEGHGRNIPKDLPKRDETIDMPDDEKFCPHCGLPYEDLGSEECSHEVGVEKEYYVKVKGKLRVAGRSAPAGFGDKSAPDQAACPVSARRPEARQAT